MCTYSQLKKKKKCMCNPPPSPPVGQWRSFMSQNCTRLAEKLSQNVLKLEA